MSANRDLSDQQLTWLREHAADRLAGWEQQLRAAGVPLSRAVLCGSLQTGLLQGAKSAWYSANPDPPPRPRVIEVDVRFILHKGVDLTHPALLDVIARTTGTRLARCTTTIRWERPVPMATLYSHEILDALSAVEWEVCVNTEPYFESTPYWRDVFAPAEIIDQRRLRASSLRSRVPRSHYEAVKAAHGAEFRWRVASGLAWRTAVSGLPDSLQALSAVIHQYPAVGALTAKARAGNLPRPYPPGPWGRRLQEVTDVQPPDWVSSLIQVGT